MPASGSSKAFLLLVLFSCSDTSAPVVTKENPDVSRPTPKTQFDATAVAPIRPKAVDANKVANSHALVDIGTLDTDIILDMRYAGNNNFVGRAVYRKARCLLRTPVAQALARVQSRLAKQSVRLLIWDCYRPFSVQEEFWRLMPDTRYVAKPMRRKGEPWRGSKHNRGAAIDVSLAGEQGEALLMPTDHDDFSKKASRDAVGISKEAARNAKTLESAMQAEGFEGLASEWWHYDYQGWQDYDLSDQEL